MRPLVLLFVALALACAQRRTATPAPGGPEMIVLLPNTDGGATGGATVSSQAGKVDLDEARESTVVIVGQAPSPPATLDEAEVNRLFVDALSSLPMAPQSFVLYFRFESDELTDESRLLLPDVVRSVAAHPAPDVVVVGHTDTTGDARTNLALGLDRARAVRGVLIRAGLDASLIEVTSHGESELLVRTPDETLEPRNRRVEIAVR